MGPARAIDLALLHRGELVFEHGLAVVEQAADQRGLAVVHAAGRGEAQKVLFAGRWPNRRPDKARGRFSR